MVKKTRVYLGESEQTSDDYDFYCLPSKCSVLGIEKLNTIELLKTIDDLIEGLLDHWRESYDLFHHNETYNSLNGTRDRLSEVELCKTNGENVYESKAFIKDPVNVFIEREKSFKELVVKSISSMIDKVVIEKKGEFTQKIISYLSMLYLPSVHDFELSLPNGRTIRSLETQKGSEDKEELSLLKDLFVIQGKKQPYKLSAFIYNLNELLKNYDVKEFSLPKYEEKVLFKFDFDRYGARDTSIYNFVSLVAYYFNLGKIKAPHTLRKHYLEYYEIYKERVPRYLCDYLGYFSSPSIQDGTIEIQSFKDDNGLLHYLITNYDELISRYREEDIFDIHNLAYIKELRESLAFQKVHIISK